MKINLAADHRGFQLKEYLKPVLESQGYETVDCGAYHLDPNDDYVDVAKKALDSATFRADDIAILICGSGHGMDIVANRYPHIRAILGFNETVAAQGRNDENANTLILPADWLKPEEAYQVVNTFLSTPFSNAERHLRRISKINQP